MESQYIIGCLYIQIGESKAVLTVTWLKRNWSVDLDHFVFSSKLHEKCTHYIYDH